MPWLWLIYSCSQWWQCNIWYLQVSSVVDQRCWSHIWRKGLGIRYRSTLFDIFLELGHVLETSHTFSRVPFRLFWCNTSSTLSVSPSLPMSYLFDGPHRFLQALPLIHLVLWVEKGTVREGSTHPFCRKHRQLYIILMPSVLSFELPLVLKRDFCRSRTQVWESSNSKNHRSPWSRL